MQTNLKEQDDNFQIIQQQQSFQLFVPSLSEANQQIQDHQQDIQLQPQTASLQYLFPEKKDNKCKTVDNIDALEGQTSRKLLFQHLSILQNDLPNQKIINDDIPDLEQDTPIIKNEMEPQQQLIDQQNQFPQDQQQLQQRQTRKKSSKIQSSQSNVSQSLSQSKSYKQYKLSIKSLSKMKIQNNIQIQKIPRQPKEIWKVSMIIIIGLVNRIITKLKRILFFRRPNQLTFMQLQAINDLASKNVEDDWGKEEDNIREYLKQQVKLEKYLGHNNLKQFKIIKKKFKQSCLIFITIITFIKSSYYKIGIQLGKRVPIFDPMTRIYAFWEILICLLTLINFIHIPLKVCFNALNLTWGSLYIINSILFIIDMIIQANTSFFDKNNSITNHRDIFVRYLRTNFLPDFISLLFLLLESNEKNFSILIFMIRILYFRNILTIIKQQFFLSIYQQATLKMIILIFKITYVIHVISCALYKLGKYEQENSEDSWLQRNGILQLDSQTQYLNCYFIISQNFQQSIQINSSLEKLFFTILNLVYIISIGYIIKTISDIIVEFNKYDIQYQQKLDDINYYLQSHDISQPLQRKVKKYIEYENKQEINHNNAKQQSIYNLSKFLKEEILKEVNLAILKRIKLFKNNFSNQFLEKLALKMTEHIYGPQQLIIQQHQIESPSIYIITKGEVELYIDTGNKLYSQQTFYNGIHSLRRLYQFDYFGEMEFFTSDYQTKLSARSMCVTTIHKININDFLELCSMDSQEREMFSFIKDNIIFNKRYSVIQMCCLACKSSNHQVLDCPYFFYGQNKEQIINKYQRQIDITIYSFKRKNKGKFQSIVRLKEVQDKIVTYIQNNANYLLQKFDLDSYDFDDDGDENSEDSDSSKSAPSYIDENNESQDADSMQNLIEQEMKLNLIKVSNISKNVSKSEQNIKHKQSSSSIKNKNSDISEIVGMSEDRENSRCSVRSSSISKKQSSDLRINLEQDSPIVLPQNKNVDESQRKKSKKEQILQPQEQSPSSNQVFNFQSSIADDLQDNKIIGCSTEDQQQQQNQKELPSSGAISSKTYISKQSRSRISSSKKLSQFSDQNIYQSNSNIASNNSNNINHQDQLNFMSIIGQQKMNQYNILKYNEKQQQFDQNDEISFINTMKSYQIYFPLNNADKVIENFNCQVRKKPKKMKSKTSIKKKNVKTSNII